MFKTGDKVRCVHDGNVYWNNQICVVVGQSADVNAFNVKNLKTGDIDSFHYSWLVLIPRIILEYFKEN